MATQTRRVNDHFEEPVIDIAILAATGFSTEVDGMLMKAAKVDPCPEREKCMILLLDEMHIREDLVFDMLKRSELTRTQQNKLLLSAETRLGLKMTCKCQQNIDSLKYVVVRSKQPPLWLIFVPSLL